MLRRGFKAQSERRSAEIRKGLRLTAEAPLLARKLAEQLSIGILSATDVPGVDPKDLNQLTKVDPDCWSAFTMRLGSAHLVVFNPAQTERRINSVLMHELAHILLGHELIEATTTADGHLTPSRYDQDQEDEANWLGGALLLPRPALVYIRRKGWSDEVAQQNYTVSGDMLQWRFRMTGVDYQLQSYKRG